MKTAEELARLFSVYPTDTKVIFKSSEVLADELEDEGVAMRYSYDRETKTLTIYLWQ